VNKNQRLLLDDHLTEAHPVPKAFSWKQSAQYLLPACLLGVICIPLRPYMDIGFPADAYLSLLILTTTNILLLRYQWRTRYRYYQVAYVWYTILLWMGFFLGVLLTGSDFWSEVLGIAAAATLGSGFVGCVLFRIKT
jgi:hypothetical protein